MNIFATSSDPRECAQALDSRRLVKMVTETAQILCSASGSGPYRPTHVNHPVVRWCARDWENRVWTYHLFLALNVEYSERFRRVHASFKPINKHFSLSLGSELDLRCMEFQNSARNTEYDLDFTYISDVHVAYQEYLITRWRLEFVRASEPPREYMDSEYNIRLRPKYPPPTWGTRGPPDWAKSRL